MSPNFIQRRCTTRQGATLDLPCPYRLRQCPQRRTSCGLSGRGFSPASLTSLTMQPVRLPLQGGIDHANIATPPNRSTPNRRRWLMLSLPHTLGATVECYLMPGAGFLPHPDALVAVLGVRDFLGPLPPPNWRRRVRRGRRRCLRLCSPQERRNFQRIVVHSISPVCAACGVLCPLADVLLPKP